MARRIAAEPEIAGSADEAKAKVIHPDSIDDHTRSQGIVSAGDGARKVQASAAVRESLWFPVGKTAEEMRRRFDTRVVGISAQKHMRDLRLRNVLYRHRALRRAIVGVQRANYIVAGAEAPGIIAVPF